MGDDLSLLDAGAQAALVRDGTATPAELVEAALARIEALDGRLGAVIDLVADAALAAATGRDAPLPDGPFRGVPFLMKDIGATQAGVACWWGNRARRAHGGRPTADTELGARFRRAGLVTLGTSNSPELAATPTCNPVAHGTTVNPWDPDRSPAGSSGGACAAVAAGLVPIAHASDGGGSIRLPAAWCGLVGLKPSRGRIPHTGVIRNSVDFVVSRSVRDSAVALDAVAGATTGDLWREGPWPGGPVAATLGPAIDAPLVHPDGRPWRVALVTAPERGVDPDCIAAAERAAASLEAAGATVEHDAGAPLFAEGHELNGLLWVAASARRLDAIGEAIGRPLTEDDVEPYNWRCAQYGWRMTAPQWLALQERQHAWAGAVHRWFDGYDLVVTPTTGCPPLRTAELDPDPADPLAMGATYGLVATFTIAFNVSGHPAVSVPMGATAAGLPLGAHLVGPMGREDVLLRLAARLEAEHPWADRLPALHASRRA